MSDTWSSPTSWDVVRRRAGGRRKYHAIRRLKADLRRSAMARRLNELRDEAWRKFSRGDTTRLPQWVPFGAQTQLAREFAVSRDTVWRDLKAVDAWQASLQPPSRPRPPWLAWAREGSRMGKRITVRVPDEVYAQLATAVEGQGTDVSDVVRQALLAHLKGGPPHEAAPDAPRRHHPPHQVDDCARVLLRGCEPDTRARIIATAERLGWPLAEVIAALLLQRSTEAGPTRQP